MNGTKPQYLLSVETGREHQSGGWRFVLKAREGCHLLDAEDVEPNVRGERLELLTMVRALEALDQPSHVIIHGCTTYLRQGVQFGLAEWRSNDWQWERFGRMAPIKNVDLWRRMEHLLDFHRVEFRQRRFDAPHAAVSGNHFKSQPASLVKKIRQVLPVRSPSAVRRRLAFLRRRVGEWLLMFRNQLTYSLLRVE